MRRARLALLAALVLAFGPGASAQAVRSEGIGRASLAGGSRVPARAAALEAALRDAVLEAAEALTGPASSPAAEAQLEAALAPDPARFALTYRTLSEREETRPRAAGSQGSGSELVLTIEAQVDRPRLAAALGRAGLLAEEAATPAEEAMQRIVVEPVPAWPALATLRQHLLGLGARRVLIAEVGPGRVVLAVEGRSADSLARAVIAAPPPGIRVETTGASDGTPRIRLEGAPLTPADAAPPIDTPAAKR